MRQLTPNEVLTINGGIHLKFIEIFAAVAIGAITGGPVGIGMALSGLVMHEGLTNLDEMYTDEFGNVHKR